MSRSRSKTRALAALPRSGWRTAAISCAQPAVSTVEISTDDAPTWLSIANGQVPRTVAMVAIGVRPSPLLMLMLCLILIGVGVLGRDTYLAHEVTRREQRMVRPEREAARAARRTVIANNKAWASAETVRRTWLRSFLTRRSAPKGTVGFLAAALVHDTHQIHKGTDRGHALARELFGCPQPDSPSCGAGTAQLAGSLTDNPSAGSQLTGQVSGALSTSLPSRAGRARASSTARSRTA